MIQVFPFFYMDRLMDSFEKRKRDMENILKFSHILLSAFLDLVKKDYGCFLIFFSPEHSFFHP